MKISVAGFGQEIFIRNYITQNLLKNYYPTVKPERRALKEA